MSDERSWYKDAVFYELHVSAFLDSNADRVEGEDPEEGATAKWDGRAVQSNTIRPGDRMQAGIAALAEGMVVADLVVAEGGASPTRLRGTGPRGSWTATLPRAYVLRDSRPRVGVLVEVQDPAPHLFVLREGDLSRVLDGARDDP